MAKVDRTFQPSEKELITLGLIAQQNSMTALQLEQAPSAARWGELKHWIAGRNGAGRNGDRNGDRNGQKRGQKRGQEQPTRPQSCGCKSRRASCPNQARSDTSAQGR